MPTLVECLNASSRRTMRAIARAREIPLRSKWLKPELVAILSESLADRRANRRLITALGTGTREYELLSALRDAGGSLPLAWAEARFGVLRPYRPWRPDGLQRPWEHPVSATERLVFLGIVFVIDGDVTMASDVAAQVSSLLSGPATIKAPTPEAPTADAPPLAFPETLGDAEAPLMTAALDAIHDIAVLLGLLDRRDVRTGPGASPWLPPSVLTAWGNRCVDPPRAKPASELKTDRRRFLHYLIKGARATPDGPPGLVAVTGGCLKPTAAACAWLGASAGDQLRALLRQLANVDRKRWSAFRLPGHTLPFDMTFLIRAMLGQPRLPGNASAAELSDWLLMRDSVLRRTVSRDVDGAELGETILALGRGPLAWLGLMRPATDGDFACSPWAARWPAIDTVIEAMSLSSLPPAIEWRSEISAPDNESTPPSRLAQPSQSTLIIRPTQSAGPTQLTRRPRAMDVFWLEALSKDDDAASISLQPRSGTRARPPADRRCRITAPSFVAALHRGHSLPRLATALGDALGRPLNAPERDLLRQWAAAADRVVIRALPVLETSDPALIAAIADPRPQRSLVRRTLGPRAVTVDAARMPALVRKITALTGVPPRLTMPVDAMAADADLGSGHSTDLATGTGTVIDPGTGLDTDYSTDVGPYLSTGLGPGGAAQLWLAARVYQALGRWAPLPAPVSQRVLDHLARVMTFAECAAAEQAAQDVVDAVAQAMEGYLAYSAGDAAEATSGDFGAPDCLPTIEAAMATGDNLDITYYTAGRGEASRRTVEPFRLDWRRGVPYLVAFCRRAGAERVFRVDRITAIAPVALEREGAAAAPLPPF